MSIEMWIVLAILIGAIVLFVTEWLRVDVVAMGVVILLMVTGTLTPAQALSGFSSSLVMTIIALFVVGGAVLRTGLAATIGKSILRVAGDNETRLMVVITLAVALLSGFMSDTGTVAVLLPAIVALAAAAKLSPSKLLIPLSYGSLLGGAMTLIGTPPNIVVAELLREEGLQSFGFFSYTPVGIALLVTGLIFMVTIGRRLLPDNGIDPRLLSTDDDPLVLWEKNEMPSKVTRLLVTKDSCIADKTIAECNMRRVYGVNILEVLPVTARPIRMGALMEVSVRPPSNNGNKPIYPTPETVIHPGDVMVVQGDSAAIDHVVEDCRLIEERERNVQEEQIANEDLGLAEAVLPPRSRLIGKTLAQTRFANTYKLTVLHITRPRSGQIDDMANTRLEMGDSLLVQGDWDDIVSLKDSTRDFVLIGDPEAHMGAPNRNRAWVAAIIMVLMLLSMVGEVAPIVVVSMVAAMTMVLSGCLTMDDAYASIDWKSVVLIAGMLPMSTALEQVGFVSLVAQGLTDYLGVYGPLAIMAGLFLLTSLFTQFISNTATAVVIAPIALATATRLGVAPQAFLMAIAIAASMAFASPVASPVNTLVMGAGNYKFSDYMRIGIPMIFLMLIVTLIGVPLMFPF